MSAESVDLPTKVVLKGVSTAITVVETFRLRIERLFTYLFANG